MKASMNIDEFLSDDEQDSLLIAEINITPLVDVMLVLLIIFIITVPIFTNTFSVNVPRVAKQESPLAPLGKTLFIQKNGNYVINNQPVSSEVLIQVLQRMTLMGESLKISADKDASYQNIANVLAMTKQAGVVNIEFIIGVKVTPS
jgi:biopolymer transport protein ExbD